MISSSIYTHKETVTA